MDFLDPNPSPRLSGRYDRGYLPHVRAQGRSYFVTFRLEGTLPQEVLRQFQAEREALLAQITSDQNDGSLSPEDQQRLVLQLSSAGPGGKDARPLRQPRMVAATIAIGAALSILPKMAAAQFREFICQ